MKALLVDLDDTLLDYTGDVDLSWREACVTVAVPAGVPNNRIEANTKASETEMYAFIDGTLTLNEPVRSVRRARIIQRFPIGSQDSWYTE